MEFIEGYTLGEKVWVGLTENDQDIIISKIAEQLQLLRAIPSQGYYGRVNYQSFGPTMSIMRTRGTEMHGPYDTYHDFIEAMYRSAELRQADCSKSPNFHAVEIEFLSRFKAILGGSKGYKPVLTHMDPKLQNIIARPILGDGGDIKDWEVVFVDWEAFGWLPEFLQILRLEDRGSLRGENFEKFHKKLHSHFEDSYEAERDFCWNASLRTCFRLL
jgi:hypothetical protein